MIKSFRTFWLNIIMCVVLCFLPLAVLASEDIRVALADDQRTVTLKSPKGLVVEGGSSGRHGEKKIVFGSASVGTRTVRVRSRGEVTEVNGGNYRGWIELRRKKNGLLLVINELDIEDYLLGVIAAEVPHDWDIEVLKAQAVASRTFALYQKRTSGKRPFHILATVDGQVYSGRNGERESSVRAVRETKGIVIVYDGEVIPAFYHASCGGHTEDAAELWGIDVPYLKGVDCECQEISKYGLWEKRISATKLATLVGRQGYRLNGITGIEMDSITPAGRVRQVTIHHAGGTVYIPAETLRAAVGYSFLPSAFFEPAMEGNEVVFYGRGLGHGVGLCQWGAKEMARHGSDFKSILLHYYPGTTLKRIEEL
jgi:stage II sporulation protein D